MQPLCWHISNIHNPNHFVSFQMHNLILGVLLKLTKEYLFATSFELAPSFLSFSCSSLLNFSCFCIFLRFATCFERCTQMKTLKKGWNLGMHQGVFLSLTLSFFLYHVFTSFSWLCPGLWRNTRYSSHEMSTLWIYLICQNCHIGMPHS